MILIQWYLNIWKVYADQVLLLSNTGEEYSKNRFPCDLVGTNWTRYKFKNNKDVKIRNFFVLREDLNPFLFVFTCQSAFSDFFTSCHKNETNVISVTR